MQKIKSKNHITSRLNILFLIVFLLFSVLIVQLVSVQIVKNEEFEKEVARQENSTVSLSVPRGKIYDRNGKIVVDNTQQRAITYTRYKNVGNEDMLKTAEKLAEYIDVKTDKIPLRDKKDFWIMTRDKEGDKLVSKEEIKTFQAQKKEESEIYDIKLSRVTEDNLQEIQGEELQVVEIFRRMKSGYKMTPQMIKNEDVTDREFAIVSEKLEELSGVDVISDWTRSYPNGDTLRSVLGNVSKEGEGLPDDQLDYYLALGYNRNDRVGKSYIERQYEDVLHGKKAKVKTILDQTGKKVIDTEVIYKGKQGDNLNLAFDADLQKAVEEIITEEMEKYKGMAGYDLMDRSFVVMMDPYTGEILSMAGKKLVKKEDRSTEIQDYALGAMNSAYEMGSVVKGATILAGLQTGAISETETFNDEPIWLKGNPKEKKSWTGGIGTVNAEQALAVSSNSYMFKAVIKMLGLNYSKDMSLPFENINNGKNIFDTLRYYFNQFGLGVTTGIDLPNETIGIKGKDDLPGLSLDFGIGQYDTYTALQLAQYISTIANGGYRMKPQIVKSITEANNNPESNSERILESIEPVVLNRIDMLPEHIQKIQRGFEMVADSPRGTAYRVFGKYKPEEKPALKTGTAQAFVNGIETYNYTLVGYAPSDKPEIAFSVVVPSVRQTNQSSGMSLDVGKRILDKYFELKKARGLNGKLSNEENGNESEESSSNE
ncbi:peptidoglycan D,D-transpeptidase FtsI family protein [Priestia taiwanensis]|uniref:serine-type D-Ala-D-Ala carboxypeptidase n=1 Tax=Priestia taiwanensis TaxID=1347902 RepID=A0A917APW0_9BACI|nr:penicillin-binding protein 2 [Priestia taiwanensis]MBM7362746.1 cell division protein FtsI/penicillin-binding protein 2 [Priestia taiwanensis]GGE64740.1 penicillin-binding protein [Priestia taiwanensis]